MVHAAALPRLARLRGPVMRWTARRIQAAPTVTWHRVSAMGLLAFIGGFMSLMPLGLSAMTTTEADSAESFVYSILWDVDKGAVITLAFGFALTATSILITQASGTIERAEQSRSLHRMGALQATACASCGWRPTHRSSSPFWAVRVWASSWARS